MNNDSNDSRLSDEDINKIARAIVNQLFKTIDISVGASIRRRILWIVAASIVAAGVALHIIDIDFPAK